MPDSSNHADDNVPRPVGRPRGFDADVILDQAVELFWKRGYQSTTTRDLESALGLTQSSIYNTFGSKQQLFEAALDRYESMTADVLLIPLEQSEEGLAAVDAFFVTLKDWVTHKGRRGCMLVNMMAENGSATPEISKRCQAYQQRVSSGLRAALSRASNDAELDCNVDVDEASELLIGLVLGLNIAARGGASDQELGSMLKAIRTQLRNWRTP